MASTMDTLAKEQEVIGQTIQKIIRNFKKDPADRKTLQYCEERLHRLNEQWVLFNKNHTTIKALEDAPEDHIYFSQSCYITVWETYEEFRKVLENKIQLFNQNEGSDEPSNNTDGAKGGAIPKVNSDAASLEVTSDVNRLRRRQLGIIESLRRLMRTINQTEPQSRLYYEHKIRLINHYWTQIEDLNHTIWEVSENQSTIGTNIEEYIQLEEETQNLLIDLSTRLNEYGNATTTGSPMIQLPKIVLPKFDGDYLKWKQFSDLFTEMVHKQAMPNCQKMWYLKTNLLGEAERLLRHFTLSEENYATAWKTLQERYNNQRLLVASLINKLLSQPSQTSETSSAAVIKALHDTTKECLLGLQNLGVPTNNWDPLLLHILVKKLDKATHTLYEQSLAHPRELQLVTNFLSFIEMRFQSLEALGNKPRFTIEQRNYVNPRTTTSLATTMLKCVSCKGNHPLYACREFGSLSPERRLKLVQQHKLCVNCFKGGHNSSTCTLRGCTKCNKKHNSLVHLSTDRPRMPNKTIVDVNENTVSQLIPKRNESTLSVTALTKRPPKGYVLLSKAKVKLALDNGQELECRAILDSGSQVNVISERLVKKLGIRPARKSIIIEGIGKDKQGGLGRVNMTLKSRLNNFSTRIEAVVLQHIVSMQPSQKLDVSSWKIPNNLSLADPTFSTPGSIDLLIGAEFYHQLLSVGQIKLGSNLPILQNTLFGWIVSGKIAGIPVPNILCNVTIEDESLDKTIQRFWEIEEAEDTKTILTPQEKRCELHYDQTVLRQTDGRFIVQLPFSEEPTRLGESKDIALRRFFALEKRLMKNNELRTHYVEFMDEYIKLGHMKEVNTRNVQFPYYYIPHHCVLKPNSSTTKLRVVFDASSKTSSNISLNDILLNGLTIQDDLFTILLRFRMPRFVFTADIQKMYRQILLHGNDQRYHLIYWRKSPNEPLKTYRLCTVTYGTTSAPYLAVKCLKKLSEQGSNEYPLGAAVLSNDFYVDDCMSGSNSIRTAKNCQEQLMSLLDLGGFKLRKWCANHPQLLRDIPPDHQELQLDFTKEDEDHIKTLGLIWLPKTDQFRMKVNKSEELRITKRIVESDIARLFDPLGMMAPVVITAKIFLQELWQLKLHWDAALPVEMHTRWMKFRDNLNTLNDVHIQRHIYAHEIPKITQLHAFADASEKAYGAAIYIRSITNDGKIIVRLLCAKSRVAPLKNLSIPRLELCAAKLAAELTNRVKIILKLENASVTLWSDSEIVLNWINSPSSTFQTFVANRIAAIQEITVAQQWRHVSSKDNPADVISRGISPEKFKSYLIWIYGTQFLHGSESIWPPPFKQTTPCELERKRIILLTQDKEPELVDGINHRNSFRKLQRIVGYVIRFIQSAKEKERPVTKILTPKELDQSLHIIIKFMQAKEFKETMIQLKKNGELAKNSALIGLTPFIDNNGMLRVGGRLNASNLSYDAEHQILLPYSHQLTRLLMTELHQENLHIGPQGLLSTTRQRFWPIKGKIIARSIVHNCVRCAKARPKFLSQIMGNLPEHRIHPARPFVNAGVDFCGPIWTHYRLRGKRPQKSYVAVFCCFATKAVHLEVVTDLTTDAFIGALRRFIGRRGHCSNLYCDNATNFVGARNRLEELSENIYSNQAKDKIQVACSKSAIQFHFIPPRAPHFGGLWEAAVKSAKHLLKRSVESASLTYEELETVMVEIEAILNSRPLTAMSNDPNDMTALTPGHFLIGEPLTAKVDPNAEAIKGGLLSRWKLVSHIKNEFWRRWSVEYLHELQYRSTWKKSCQNINPDTIVIIREDNLPVMKWPLGRIVKAYKGNDGYVRVADVRTSTGIIRRPINRLAPLPSETNNTITEQTVQIPSEEDYQFVKRTREEKETDEIQEEMTNTNPTEDSNNSKSKQKRRRKISYASSIVTILLACLIMPPANGSPINHTKFTSQPGIHFDNIGITKIISNEWNLVVYYDLQPYWNAFEALNNGTAVLDLLCSKIKQKGSCVPLLDQFHDTIMELTQDNSLLNFNTTGNRPRRGAVNIIGNIANSLFGVLDNQYAENMSKTISNIRTNEDHFMKLMKNQTSIIDSTINVIKINQELIKRKFDAIDNQLSQITNQNQNNTEELYQQRLQHVFSSWSTHITLTIITLQRTQAAIIDVITDSHHGKINHLLLSPQQLNSEIQKIKAHLPTSSHLPADDLLHIYKLMKSEGRILHKHAIFKIKLPLVHQDKFELFRLLPIPATFNNTRVVIEISTSLLAINLHRDRYYPMTENELSSCTQAEELVFLCKQFHPIFSRRIEANTCEFNIFNNITTKEECKLKNAENVSSWINLSQVNQWMYALTEKIVLNTVCNDTALPVTLEGAGIITIQPGCTIRHELLTIQGYHEYHSQLRLSHTILKDPYTLVIPDHSTIVPNDTVKYKGQHLKIKELLKHVASQDLELPTVINDRNLHHTIVGYMSLALGIIITIFLAWKIRTLDQLFKTGKKPIPLPRQTLSLESTTNSN